MGYGISPALTNPFGSLYDYLYPGYSGYGGYGGYGGSGYPGYYGFPFIY